MLSARTSSTSRTVSTSAVEVSTSMWLDNNNVRSSIRTVRESEATCAARSVCTSTVRQSGDLRARWCAMRSAISSSRARAVAT